MFTGEPDPSRYTEGFMQNYPSLHDAIVSALELQVPPIAVVFSDEAPANVPAPAGPVAAGCAFWELAAKGPVTTVARDHDLCSIGIYTHNLADAPAQYESELSAVLGVLAGMQYVRPEDVPGIATMSQRHKHVVYAPLRQTPLAPQAVLLFAQSAQSLVITEAVQQVDGGVPPALGRPACAVIPQAIGTGRAALSLGCCGARAYLGILSDEIALWALPGNKLAAYAERLQVLGEANRTLRRFHALRARDVAAGLHPTYAESLSRMS